MVAWYLQILEMKDGMSKLVLMEKCIGHRGLLNKQYGPFFSGTFPIIIFQSWVDKSCNVVHSWLSTEPERCCTAVAELVSRQLGDRIVPPLQRYTKRFRNIFHFVDRILEQTTTSR